MFLNFSTQWNSIGQRNQCWKAALESLSSSSLFSFSELNKALWHKRIHLMKGSDFPSTKQLETRSNLFMARNILLAIHHFHTYSFSRITSNEPVCFEGWNKFSVRIIMRPWEPNLTHRHSLSLRRKQFSSSAGLLLGVSLAITDRTRGFGDKSNVLLHFCENLGLG